MKKIISIALSALLTTTLLVSCGTGGLDGTYVPKNCEAKNFYIAKLVFNEKEASGDFKIDGNPFTVSGKGNTVKMYMGAMGIAMPVGLEYRYNLEGNKLTIEGGIPGVDGGGIEFTYNKAKDEISLLTGIIDGALDEYAPVWCKEGNAPKDPCAEQGKPNGNTSREEITTNVSSTNKPDINSDQGSNTRSDDKGTSWNYNPNVFDQRLAETCAMYSSEAYHREYIEEHLKKDHYIITEKSTFLNDQEDGIGYTLAHQEVNGNEVLLAVIIRGTVGKEWQGDMKIWKNEDTPSERHYSFENANVELQKAINDYISTNGLKKNINLLITGHSRGAAVGNLLAVDSKEPKWCKGNIQNVYAYLFATPNNSTKFSKYGYENIFNFCFDDDFVPQVPLDINFSKWSYGKSGITYKAVAEGLYYINPEFKKKVDEYIKNLYNHEPNFNYKATQKVLGAFHKVAPSVNDYYNTKPKLKMEPLNGWTGVLLKSFLQWTKKPILQILAQSIDPEEDKTLFEFMRDYIAGAMIAYDERDYINSALVGTGTKVLPGNDVQEIATFFVVGGLVQPYINDTHQANTYYYALTTNGFLTQSFNKQ